MTMAVFYSKAVKLFVVLLINITFDANFVLFFPFYRSVELPNKKKLSILRS